MKQLPIKENGDPIYNQKAVKIIALLVVCGIITGIALSYVFVYEANQRIEHFDEDFRFPRPDDFSFTAEPLAFSDIIIPSLGVIIVCISMFLLIGLIVVYFKIFMKTNSRYIGGLLFVLAPLFIQSVFSIGALRSLFVSPAIPWGHIRDSIGFGFGGFGSILFFVSIFEIIGLSILLYLSAE